MLENYEHYISKNIRAFFKRKLFSPIIYIILMAIVWFVFPLSELLHPHALSEDLTLAKTVENVSPYVKATLSDLTFSGYTCKRYGKTIGYYYYSYVGEELCITLLSPSICEQGVPHIEELTFSAKITAADKSYTTLLGNIAKSMNWTDEGINGQLPKYYLNEPAFHKGFVLFFFLYFGTIAYSAISLIRYLLIMHFPYLAPCCQNLLVYGNPKHILEQAEDELATLPQLATEDMFITEHYFIVTSPSGNALVPIKEILWIYKHSTLHKILWYHFSISYTLHISANKHLYIKCPKNMKSDIDGIMDYLAEANHNILVGFSEENRLKIDAVQGKPLHIEKLYALLRKRI